MESRLLGPNALRAMHVGDESLAVVLEKQLAASSV
jgi:hypothetical protein